MREVARAAGVSVPTVSNVLNRSGRFGEETRRRVERAVAELGYVRRWTARGLRSDRAGQLAYLIADTTSRFFERSYHQEVLAGLAEVARGSGYAVVLQGSMRRESELRSPLLDGRADGAVVSISGTPARRLLQVEMLAAIGRPIVTLDEPAPPEGVATVVGADAAAVGQAVDHLVSVGHERIALLIGKKRWPDVEAKERGFRAALQAHGIEGGARLVERIGNGSRGETIPEIAARATTSLLRGPSAPSALVGGSDQICTGILRAVRSLGLEIRREVGVVGILDEHVASSLLETPLTAVQISRFEMGRRAGELLLARLETGSFPSSATYVPARLVVREST